MTKDPYRQFLISMRGEEVGWRKAPRWQQAVAVLIVFTVLAATLPFIFWDEECSPCE